MVYKHLPFIVKPFGLNKIAFSIFATWQTALLNQILRRLKGSYDLVPSHVLEPLINELRTLFESQPQITIPEGTITKEWFANLKMYFEEEEQAFFAQALDRLEPEVILANQESFKKDYADIVFLIENTKQIFDRHIHLFTPFRELTTDQKPTIRLITLLDHTFYFAHEVDVAIRLLMKKRNPNPKLLKDLIMLESEKERKNGIVYALKPSRFAAILKKLGLSYEDFVILEKPCEIDYRCIPYPTISSYGTHCIPAADAFDSFIYYLAAILKVFLRCNTEGFEEVVDWIKDMMDPIFVEKPVLYLIEVWKIDKIIDRARRELSHLLTEPGYEVPFKETYRKNEIFCELLKMTRNCKLNKKSFLKLSEHVLNWTMEYQPAHYKNVYYGYSLLLRYYLQNHNMKIENFICVQRAHEEKTRACADTAKQIQEDFEKLQIEANELKKKLAAEEVCQEFAKSQNGKTQIEDNLNSQLEKAAISCKEQVQKARKILKRSPEADFQLEKILKTLELAVSKQKENGNKKDEETILLKGELEKATTKNIELESKCQLLDEEREDLKQDLDLIMPENEQLRADNFKNMEVQLNVMELRTAYQNQQCLSMDDSQEPEQNEEVDEPSCCTENAENHTERFEEKLEKLQEDENDENQHCSSMDDLQESDQKKEIYEPSCIENAENQAQQFERKLKKLQEDEKKFEKQLEEELEEEEEDLWMTEIVKRRADSSKYTEFQQKVKEHIEIFENQNYDSFKCDLWSRFKRICSRCPESLILKQANYDVIRREDFPE